MAFRFMCDWTWDCETPELARFMGPKGLMDAGEFELRHSPQAGIDTSPSYYSSSFPAKMREAYVKQWHEEHDPTTGQRTHARRHGVYSGHDWDDMTPHSERIFPVGEIAQAGDRRCGIRQPRRHRLPYGE